VFLGYRLYDLLRPALFVVGICLIAAFGLLITAFANHLAFTYLGFSVFFGFANGLGYGYALHIFAQSNEHRKGLGIGFGAMAFNQRY